MKPYKYFLLLMLVLFTCKAFAQQPTDSAFMVKAFTIGVPRPDGVADFIKFINEELVPHKINTLILEVDYKYQFKSHPELRDSMALSKSDVKKLVEACKKDNINLIPMIDLLGHQSWANRIGMLLKVYPQFDETPWVANPSPGTYKWPNADNLYCRSYCPLYPGIHKIIFDLVDEVMDAFEAKDFHAGMDEVFYLGEDKCPRCAGRDKAVLFANEVQLIRDHLAEKDQRLWIWGDRLIDGRTTGIGEWAGSYNNTYRAVDLIPRDVVICDWQYDEDNQSPVYYAMKGFHVVICAWNRPQVALSQVANMYHSRAISGKEMRYRFYGIAETVWTSPVQFLNGYYGKIPSTSADTVNTQWNTFRVMFDKASELDKTVAAK